MIQTTESFANSIPVLMYHHVSSSGGPLSISPENFESQIEWLARNGYVTLTTDEFARFLHGSPMPRKSVLLTFDDGYLDNYVHAHPILLHYGLNAVMFLVTGRVHDGPFRAIEAQRLEAPRSHQACERLVHDGRADEVTVRWSEVELMRAAGTFEFHSHTHSHLRWDQLCANPAHKRQNIRLDIEKSKAILTTRLGSGSRHLCWPEGYFDADYIDAAQSRGLRIPLHDPESAPQRAGQRPLPHPSPRRQRQGRTTGSRKSYAATRIRCGGGRTTGSSVRDTSGRKRGHENPLHELSRGRWGRPYHLHPESGSGAGGPPSRVRGSAGIEPALRERAGAFPVSR